MSGRSEQVAKRVLAELGASGPTIERTMDLAAAAHAGQRDKAGAPYINHPRRVMARLLLRWPGAPIDELHAALLHDVIEDTAITVEQLRAEGYSERVLAILALLTRDVAGGETYAAFIERIAAAGDVGAIRVKLSDLADNSDPERVAALPAGDRGIVKRYETARAKLLERLAELGG